MAAVAIQLNTPSVDRLDDVARVLRDWQRDDAPIQLHPGDLGWHWRFGPEAVAAALRIWSREGRVVAIGFLDSAQVLRMTVAPEVWHDSDTAQRVVADLSEPGRGVFPAGRVSVESPDGTSVSVQLARAGWIAGEAWTPLRRGLVEPMPETDLRVAVVEPEHASAWHSDSFTDDKWSAMTAGTPFSEARCLLGYNAVSVAVAGVTVWSAGPGRPGLIEPLGVHAAHRRRGYATAICSAAADTLRQLGSSSAMVCTPSALTSAVATYRAAGFEQLPERSDRCREE
jgi:ribosomal protein S18 acetylase RimI-like enzyme